LENKFRTKNSLGKNLFAIVLVSILLASLGISANQVYAMGQAPSTCSNLYDDTITAMKIIVGHRTYDPIAHPGITFQLRNDKSYTVTFTIHTASQSSQSNSFSGDTWYDTNAPGYQLGNCVTGAGSNQNVTVTVTETHPGNIAPQITQSVSWKTLMSGDTTYNIKWINP
jgi:hypothetical protein